MFAPMHETPRRKPEPLCSPRARCYTLRFVGVPCPLCLYCERAARLVSTWEALRNACEGRTRETFKLERTDAQHTEHEPRSGL
jgi:hypothetical protein